MPPNPQPDDNFKLFWTSSSRSQKYLLFTVTVLAVLTIPIAIATSHYRSTDYRSQAVSRTNPNIPPPSTAPTDSPNCDGTTVPGLIPLPELTGSQTYLSFSGGLYPNGSNEPPANHLDRATIARNQIIPRNNQGEPDTNGQIVLMSIGMSNTKQEFTQFIRDINDNPNKSPQVVLLNGAQGGATAADWAELPTPWTNLESMLADAGLSKSQVQALWIKHANAYPTNSFPDYAQELQSHLATIIAKLDTEGYTNVKLIYLSNRIYAGYASKNLNPEPYAYQSSFAVKWLIESQINNSDPRTSYNQAPVLVWGPYLWANGVIPNSQGLIWNCEDYQPDGTHPGPLAEAKVSILLQNYFLNHALTTSWFTINPPPPTQIPSPTPPATTLTPPPNPTPTPNGISPTPSPLPTGRPSVIPSPPDPSPNQTLSRSGLSGSISYVLNGQNMPIFKALITAELSGRTVGRVPAYYDISDPYGRYQLPLEANTYIITVTAEGYFPESRIISIPPASHLTADFTLNPTEPPNLINRIVNNLLDFLNL